MSPYLALKDEIIEAALKNLLESYYLPHSEEWVYEELWNLLGTIKVPNKKEYDDVVGNYIIELGCDYEGRYPDLVHT